jgi:hypothetical protein
MTQENLSLVLRQFISQLKEASLVGRAYYVSHQNKRFVLTDVNLSLDEMIVCDLSGLEFSVTLEDCQCSFYVRPSFSAPYRPFRLNIVGGVTA